MITPLDPFDLDLEKITLIEASAGTGKTYTITTLVARLIAQGFALESILVVTFTEAAAAELKLRIRQRLAQCLAMDWSQDRQSAVSDELVRFFSGQSDADLIRKRLAYAVTCFDQACIMTIHSFCFQTLKENAFESGSYFDMELLTDSSQFFDQVCMDFFMTRINDLPSLLLKFLAQKGVTPDAFKAGFRQVVARPGMEILPNQANFLDVSDAYEAVTKKIHECLKTQIQEVIGLIQSHKGVDKRSYTKKNLPNWLGNSLELLDSQGRDALFDMTEKGDPLYKFTRTRLTAKTKQGEPPNHELFDLCEELLELSRVMETNLVSLKLEFFSYYRRELAQMKQVQGACFFDDLINDLAAALDGDKSEPLRLAVTQKFRACLIDEFQDTDPAQYRIFSKLFSRPAEDCEQIPFFMIGDPKQAIYAFRGGDIFAYLSACEQSDQKFTLEKNYRSSPLMVEGVNDLFSLDETPFLYEQIEFTRVSTPHTAVNRLVEDGVPLPPLQFSFVEREGFSLDRQGYIKKEEGLKIIPRLLAADVLVVLNSEKRLTEGAGEQVRNIGPGDMAVLVRTNSQAEAIQAALAELKIPSYLSKTGSVFDSQEAIELYDILAAVYEPDHTGLLKAALCSCVFGFSGQMLVDLDRDEKQLWKRQDQFRGFKDTWEQRGFVSMIMGLFHSDDAVLRPFSKVMASSLSERGLTNFYHLMELISQAAQEHHLSMFYLLKWYREQLFASTRNQGADELRLESDKKAVAIVTIHKSKGLEYPIVFVPYLWAGGGKPRDPIVFHDPDKDYQLCLDLKGGESDLERSRELMQFEQTAEEKRLLYVALTRASAMCRILWAGISSVDGSALGSLVHPGGCKTDDQMLEDLEALCQQGKNRVSVSRIRQTWDNGVYIPKDLPGMDLSARSRKRQVTSAWRISSFSALSIPRGGYADPYEPKGYESGTPESGTPESRESKSRESKSREYEPEAQVPLDGGKGSSQEICLKTFPKGAGSGDFFHAVFEDLDFTDIGLVEEVVDRNLIKFGIEDKTLRGPAVKAVKDILATPLSSGLDPGSGTEPENWFSLQDISMAQRFTELEFFFDVNHLDFNGMGSLFAGVPNGKTYANALFKLSVKPFKGYIKGFIDLVVLHQGKWYILDYKSNFLGTTHGDYGEKAMTTAMESHHYILQYHLYLVALHRYLGMRLKDYSYDRDFGGVFYLFIRGMHPESPEHGVFFHRPSKDFLNRFLAIL